MTHDSATGYIDNASSNRLQLTDQLLLTIFFPFQAVHSEHGEC